MAMFILFYFFGPHRAGKGALAGLPTSAEGLPTASAPAQEGERAVVGLPTPCGGASNHHRPSQQQDKEAGRGGAPNPIRGGFQPSRPGLVHDGQCPELRTDHGTNPMALARLRARGRPALLVPRRYRPGANSVARPAGIYLSLNFSRVKMFLE